MPNYEGVEIKAYDSTWKTGEVSLSKGYGNTSHVMDLTPDQALEAILQLAGWLTECQRREAAQEG